MNRTFQKDIENLQQEEKFEEVILIQKRIFRIFLAFLLKTRQGFYL